MASDHKAQKAQQNAYAQTANQAQATANTAVATASKPNPLTQRIIDHATALDDWKHGVDASGNKVPIDVRNMPGNDVSMGLFNDALKVHDAGRKGGGLGTMGDAANPNFTAALDKENEMERHTAASGALEGEVDSALANNDQILGQQSAMGEQRNQFTAGLTENAAQSDANRQLSYLLRPKPPNFFRELAMNFAQGAGAGAAGG